jgi:peptidoglycan/LPS O-acetylase OafA/YrhL
VTRRFDVELLRVVAVVGVVLFHFAPDVRFVRNGFLGVDIFFTISGFVITLQMLRSRDRGSLTYPDFLARRVRRLLPSAVLVVLVTYAVAAATRNILLTEPLRPVAIAALLYVSNFVFAAKSLDYFTTVDMPSPLLHYWSLSVEEQFYVAWPLVVLAVAYVATRRFTRVLLTTTLVLAALSLAAAAWGMQVAPDQTFYLPWARAHQLLIGAAAAILVHRGTRLRVGAWVTPLRVLAVVWLVAVQVLPPAIPSPGPASLAVSLPVALIALTGTGSDLLTRVGRLWLFAWTARLSYVIYLWHWPVWTVIDAQLPHLRGVEQIALAAAATLVLSVITHVVVEEPFRHGRRPRVPAPRIIAAGLGVSVAAAGAVFVTAALVPVHPWQKRVEPQIPALAEDISDVYARACHAPHHVTDVVVCADGDPGSATTVVTLGDSRAASWQPAFQSLARQEGWRYLSVTKSACTAWDVPIYNSHVGGRYVDCETWRHDAFARVSRERPDVVVLHGDMPWDEMLGDGGGEVSDRPATLRAAVTSSVTSLRRSGATVVALLETPEATLEVPVQQCLAMSADPSRCAFRADPGAPERAVVAEAARAAGAVVIDPYPVVCPGTRCHSVQDDVIVFRDASHLTRSYVLHRRPWVRSWLEPLLAARS